MLRNKCQRLIKLQYGNLLIRNSRTNKRRNEIVEINDNNKKIEKSPWVEQKDPNGSNLTYYWNTETNQTTPLGTRKPRHWIEVYDKNGTGLSYWWDPDSNETTALGASKPSDLERQISINNPINRLGHISSQNNNTAPSFGRTMVTYVTLGVGMTFGITLVRVLFGF